MARLPKDVVVTSHPLQTFPNGDYLYTALSRQASLYECQMRMARGGNPANSFLVAAAHGRTIRNAEANCHSRAVERAPYCPEPPYHKARTKRSPGSAAKKAAVGS